VVNRIQTSLDEWNQSSSLDNFTVSLSIGKAEWTDGKTLDEVLDLADRNMFEEKVHHAPFSEPGHGRLIQLASAALETVVAKRPNFVDPALPASHYVRTALVIGQ